MSLHISDRSQRPDPQQLLGEFGITLSAINAIEPLSERHGHGVWRVVTAEYTCILKWLPETAASVEIGGYRLLQRLGVPTLPLYGLGAQALLIEDLQHSGQWRLATAADANRQEVGQAVARWYQALHHAGERLLAQEEQPAFLKREIAILTPETILATGQALGLAAHPVWQLAAGSIDSLKRGVERLPATLNYNDFHWTNLALSRGKGELEAIIFDYDHLGIGMRYSDYRNVTSSLGESAARAFAEAYGRIDPREELIDGPLAALCTLYIASRRAQFPRWAVQSRNQVISGELAEMLAAAMERLR